MNKSVLIRTMVILMVATLIITGCQTSETSSEQTSAQSSEDSTTEDSTAEDSTAQDSDEQPYFVYISAPIGVNEFIKMGLTGLEASGEKWNAETQLMEATDPVTREEAVQEAINSEATIVTVFGYDFNDIIIKLAPTAPDTKFLIVDQCIDDPSDNVRCATSMEYEAAFLIGVEAAMLTETDHIGVVCATDIPFLHRYTDSFEEGAKYINPDIVVDVLWIGGDSAYEDPVRAKQLALTLIEDGADQIFAAAAGGNMGVFEAVQETGTYAYGVDINQCSLAPGHIVDNLIKHSDVEMELSIDAIMEGTATEVNTVYNLASGGIGLVAQYSEEELAASECVIADHPEVVEKVNEVAQMIMDGTIVLEDPMYQ